METLVDRVRNLEGWRDDAADELREWREWVDEVKPFLEMLMADLTYRQARHAEHTAVWSRRAKIVAGATAVIVAFCAIATMALSLLTFLAHGG